MGTDTALAVEKPSVLEQTIQVDEIQTRYLIAVDGPPLVLLHGAGDSARDWSWVLPLLGRSHQVLAPDLPGYSPGSGPADDYPALTMPTLIVWGTADRVIPITHGRRAVWRLSRGSLVQLSRCGHAPQVECPDGFTEALSRFLQAVGQR